MKVFVLAPNEDWICDRFCDEWRAHNVIVDDPDDADIIWLLGEWCWRRIPQHTLKKKIVVATVHHLVPDKFGDDEFTEFAERDLIVDAYHVPCKKTEKQLQNILSQIFYKDNQKTKDVFVQPFWVNDTLWKKSGDNFKEKFGLDPNALIMSSFQRDTEGKDLISPKLEKGPDIFCDTVIDLKKIFNNVHVLLGGWRRQYVISRLSEANIPFSYLERPQLSTLREMYSCTDLYIVGSRFEGGPQAIVECAAMKIPIVSRDVGVAGEILHPLCVDNDILKSSSRLLFDAEFRNESLEHNFAQVSKLFMSSGGFKPFEDFFVRLEKRSKFSSLSPGIGNRKSDI